MPYTHTKLQESTMLYSIDILTPDGTVICTLSTLKSWRADKNEESKKLLAEDAKTLIRHLNRS
jgi:hypothetical protein